jgi:peptide/nickel transport system permease protein
MGVVALLGAAALLFVATKSLTGDNMWVRVLMAFVALGVAYKGLKPLVRGIAGRNVDVAYGLSIAWVAWIAAAAILAPVLPLGEHSDTSKTLAVAGYLRPDLFSGHPLGTNQFGLDLLSRVIWGARISLTASLLAIVIGTVIGGVIGMVAGYYAGALDRGIGIGTNAALAFPPLVLLLVIAAIVGHSFFGVVFALSVLVVPGTIRFARANALTHAKREYSFVARILGATKWQVLRREILPSVSFALASIAFVTLPLLIIAEASLSYLGLGVRPPEPTWGNMIAEGGGGVFEASPHIVLVPGTILFLTVFALNIIGQRVRQRWDTRELKL